jgi:hypothetical protein
MKAQIVILKTGTQHFVPMDSDYDILKLEWIGGQQVWQKDGFSFPYHNVDCILEGKMPEPVDTAPGSQV